MAMTTVDSLPNRLQALRAKFRTKTTLSYEWRLAQLHKLKALINYGREALCQALYRDLHRSRIESNLLEINIVDDELEYAITHLYDWMQPQYCSTNLVNHPGCSLTQHDPLGVVAIFAPWNYPIQLLFTPLIGALAGGNTVVLKPSEMAHHTSIAIAQLVARFFEPDVVSTVLGDKTIVQALLTHKFDHIFMTGGSNLGKIIAQAAAKTLTPVTLELGGKSPLIIDRTADPVTTAKRVVWSAFLNAGQTCVRPDHVYLHADILEDVIPLIKRYINEFYSLPLHDAYEFEKMNGNGEGIPHSTVAPGGFGDDTDQDKSNSQPYPTEIHETTLTTPVDESQTIPAAVLASHGSTDLNTAVVSSLPSDTVTGSDAEFHDKLLTPYYGRIVNDTVMDRLLSVIEADKYHLLVGGGYDRTKRFIEPTLLMFYNISSFLSSSAMSQELFGPILPFCVYTDIKEVLNAIESQPKPLALYCFTNDSQLKQRITAQTTSGSLLFNDCIMQLTNTALPFGGVGASGMGNYHGFYSFKTFTHEKSVLYKSFYIDILARYPPYCLAKRNVLKTIRVIEAILRVPTRLYLHFQRRIWSSYKWRALIIAFAVYWAWQRIGSHRIRIAYQLLKHVLTSR